MKIHRKCNSQEAHSGDTKRRCDEEQIRTTQTPHMKLRTHKQRTATEERIGTASRKTTGAWKGGGGGGAGKRESGWGLKPVLLAHLQQILSLQSILS